MVMKRQTASGEWETLAGGSGNVIYNQSTEPTGATTGDLWVQEGFLPDFSQEAVDDVYDNTKTYALGDTCVHDGFWWVCKTAITTAEEWNTAHWTKTKLFERFVNTTDIACTSSAGCTLSSGRFFGYGPLVKGKTVYGTLLVDITNFSASTASNSSFYFNYLFIDGHQIRCTNNAACSAANKSNNVPMAAVMYSSTVGSYQYRVYTCIFNGTNWAVESTHNVQVVATGWFNVVT